MALVPRMYLIEVLLICACVDYVSSQQCTIAFPKPVAETNELAKPGTVLTSLTRSNPTGVVTFSISATTLSDPTHRADFKTFFNLQWSGTNGTFSINKTLDLEEFLIRYNATDLTTISIDFSCDGNTPTQLYIRNLQMNEFDPVFFHTPYNFTINETEPIHSDADAGPFQLEGRVGDYDIPKTTTFYFAIETFRMAGLDAKDYFYIQAETRGNLKLKKKLDYGATSMLKLNVSVKDSLDESIAKYDYTTITINVLDNDNQNPYFNLTGCPKPCIAAPYFAVVDPGYTGAVTIHPEPFRVADDDTLGTPLKYTILSGDDSRMFSINPTTGAVLQTRSVTDAALTGAEVRLVVQIRKDLTTINLSNEAILTVRINGRTPNTTNPDTASSTEGGSNTSLLIPVIILGILLLILIVALVIVVVIIYKRQKEMRVNPEKFDNDPQTEEEDLPSDRSDLPHAVDFNGKTVLNGKTTQGMTTDPFPPTPDERAGKLPPLPLRDSATETEAESRKKKRSRRRNKNKEPEIFDGTREYNMGADPEFFDSTDKSKVKRSQRSYDKKVDPALWIKVPNDQPAVNDDSGYSG